MKGRVIVFCALAFLARDFIGGWLTLPPVVYLTAAAMVSVIAYYVRGDAVPALAVLLLGATSVQVSRMPPQPGCSKLEQACSGL